MALADSRAMEEQMERHNPVNPKGLLSNRRENAMRLSGAGATPSMGLSEYRGGKHTLADHLANPTKGYGTKKGQIRKTARKAYEPESESDEECEARGMGRHLGQHLHSLHGAGFWSDFGKGFMSVIKPVAGIFGLGHGDPNFMEGMGASEQQRAGAMLGQNKKGRSRNNGPPLLSGNVNGVRSGGAHPGIAFMRGGSMGAGMLDQPMPVSGTNMSLSGAGRIVGGSMGAGIGMGQTGEYEGQGKARKPNARAAVVKRVMAEKGLKMIEASKYVKEHGLY